MLNFPVYVIVGFVLGVIAKMILKTNMGWLGTIVAGVLGALLGGFIGNLFNAEGNLASSLTNIWGWLFSILGTVIVIWTWKFISGRRG